MFTTYSIWDSQHDLDQYRRSPLFEDTWRRTREMFSDSPSTTSVGTATFTEVANGYVDTFHLNFSGATERALMNAINNSTPFSILMTAPSGSTAATFAGLQSNSFVINGGSQPDSSRTSLTLDVIPEPSTFLTILLFGAGLLVHRRLKP